MNDAQVYTGAAVMGAIAGMRSMSPPKVVSQFSEVGLIPEEGSPLAFLNHPTVSKVLQVLSTGEKIADKLPFMPARTKAGPLVTRGLSGGLSGAAIFARTKRPWWAGALIGAGTAIAASFAAYKLRKWITEEYEIPDAVVGIVEDAVVAGAGYLVLSSLKSEDSIEATSAA
jgi:uncharacterized membrane protein